jgi:GDP-L-fucose synthase
MLQRPTGYKILKEEVIDFTDQLGVPDMSYGWAKLTHEYLARLAYEKHGLKSVVYRPFSGYGEDQDDSYPFPSICKRVIANKGAKVISVWGTGNQMRDFIHIDDCVEGVMKTMDKIDDAGALNLSTGIHTSFKDFVRVAARELGFSPDVVGTSDKPEGVFARAGCPEKQKKYGFEYKIGFETGVKRALKYFQQNA